MNVTVNLTLIPTANLDARLRRILPVAALAALLAPPAPLAAQEAEPAASPPVTLVGVEVTPENPAVDTLCKLKVRIRNDGEEIASQFGFTVEVNGQALPVYDNQLFLLPAPPGEVTELPLYNFWSTETSRPAPDDGELEVEVTLEEAVWMSIGMEDDVEVWTPQGEVPGLPSSAGVTLKMAAPDS